MPRITLLSVALLILVNGCEPSTNSVSNSSPPIHSQTPEQSMTSAKGNEPVDLPQLSSGTHPQTIDRDDGTKVRFTIHVPQNYSPESSCPLIVALHFGGDVTPFYGRGVIDALIQPALKDLNAIIVAPDSIAGRWTNDTNEQAVLQVVHSILRSYSINADQILLTGFSLGGEGTFYLGGRNQDLFSAIIPVAGRPTSDAEWHIPIYAVHSEADTVVPFAPTKSYIQQLQANGVDATLNAVSGIPHFNTPAFVPALKNAVPWVRERWAATSQ